MMFDGIKINPSQLYSRQEVIDILKDGGSSDRALSGIREKYDEKFGNELIWRYPIMVGIALGTVIIPVQEGFLSIAYDEITPEDYKIYDLDNEFLLSADDIKQMKTDWDSYSRELISALQSMWQIQYKREQKNIKTNP